VRFERKCGILNHSIALHGNRVREGGKSEFARFYRFTAELPAADGLGIALILINLAKRRGPLAEFRRRHGSSFSLKLMNLKKANA
jgi:hypothetical protein